MYQVYHIKHGDVVAEFKTRKSARQRADKLDLLYGAIVYGVRYI